ncbi:MAG: hypothetical protein J7L41_03095 [Synergistetes bacterium]|nr:hypothetical protein [Synergistota bacterium]
MKKVLLFSLIFVLVSSSIAFAISKNQRIAVIIYQGYSFGFNRTIGAAEAKVIEILMNAGFKVVDENQINRIRRSKAAILALKGDVDGIMKLGSLYRIDVFLKGKAVMHRARQNEFGLYTGTASISARAYRTKDGRFIFAKSFVSKAIGYTRGEARSKALLKAATMLGRYLVGLAPSGGSDRRLHKYILRVSGMESFNQVNDVVDRLQHIPAVGKVVVADYSSGNAKIYVNYRGTISSFVNDLRYNFNNIGDLRYRGRTVYLKLE